MLKSDLLQIIANGENSGVDFKRDDIRPEQLAKALVAFANFEGGRILLGVEDDGSISGLQRDDPEAWVFNAVRDKVHPQIIPYYEVIEVEEGKRVAIVTVASGPSKPYVVRHNGREDVYIRMGTHSRLATREQQQRLFQSSGLLHVEVMPVPGTDFSAIDLDRVRFYLEGVIEDSEIPDTDAAWIGRLTAMGLMADDSLGNRVCSIAGLVCFGIRPRRYLRQAGIRLLVFSGAEQEYRAELDTVIDAALTARWHKDGHGGRELIDEGLIEKFAQAIAPYVSEESDEITTGLRREKKILYPIEAIREVIVNALAHRDWTRSVDVTVTFFSNRLEVVSPGRLPNSMTVEKMVSGQRSPRNPLIVDILRDYGYVDSRGMGIRRKVIPQMEALSGSRPEFEATEDYLKTTLLKAIS